MKLSMHSLLPQCLQCRMLLSAFLLTAISVAAQPSGGPYGPIQQTYSVPDDARHVYYVSPDGQELAFWEMGEDENRLLVIPTAEGESQKPPRELVTVEKGIRQPVAADVWWSAHERHLMYQLGEGDSARLWRVPAQGGEPEPLELILGEQPEFSPDGTRIAFDYGESAYEIWVMENYLPQGG